MRYVKIHILCLLFLLVAAANINVYAADGTGSGLPSIMTETGSSFPVDAIDKDRNNAKLTIYTANYGEYTKPFGGDIHEYIVVNNIIVNENINGTNGTFIPSNGYVISYMGINTDLTSSLTAGKGISLANIEIPVLPDMYFKLGSLLVPIDQSNTIREANQVILYDSSYGSTTRTNAWGMELTVVNGVISKIVDISIVNGIASDNNTPIPPDGIVISIHSGSPYYKQLHESCKLGSKVTVASGSKLYNASKIKYSAYNPRTIADNPESWDKAQGKPYDGYRGPNQLIVYDSGFGGRTGTNPYGYEIAVNSKGIIISTGGNDSEIPEDGYIISGHGDKVKWLQKYALLGATVEFDTAKKELLIVFSPDSYMNLADLSIKSAQDSLNLAQLQYRDIPYEAVQDKIDAVRAKLDNIHTRVNEGIYGDLVSAIMKVQTDADNAYFMTFESPKVENRAVWLRPRDTSIVQIQNRLDMLKSLNINTIYLETYWNGYAIYPTGSEIMPQNPIFNGMDILEIYLKEAHARGIEVHTWVENFLVDQPVAAKKPEWMAVSRKGENYYLENGVTKYFLLNPALPEVRAFLSELYKDLVRKYNVDGIQFDYMRYSHSGDYSNDFGYDPYTRKLFLGYTGTDPIVLKPGDRLWDKWCDFRVHSVSSYAYSIFSEVRSIKPNIKISTDVWPEYDKTLKDIYQDPKAWASGDHINSVIPMSYYLDETSVVKDIMNSLPFTRGRSQIVSGIATFNRVDTRVLLRQISAIRSSDINGIAIFEFESLTSGKYADALRLGAFSRPSAVTNRNPEQSVNIILADIKRKIDDIYLKYGGVNAEQAERYKKLLSGIYVDLDPTGDRLKAAYEIHNNIQDLLTVINTDETLNEEVADRVSIDLNNSLSIIEAYISDMRLMSSHKVRRFQAEIPLLALENKNAAPVKIKAVFDDNSSMYLDSSQYTFKSDDPTSAEAAGAFIRPADIDNGTVISIYILDSFKFAAVNGTARKIEIDFGKYKKVPEPVLTASEAGYTDVMLDWGTNIVDSEIAWYVIYRDDKEIVRLSSDTYTDSTLQPGASYNYMVHGFDTEGNIVYTSNQLTVRTKAGPLLTSP